MKFQFRHEYWGDDWQDLSGDFFDHEAAEHVAEEHWRDDPCDPDGFRMSIDVRSIFELSKVVTVNVTAEASVNFYGRAVGFVISNPKGDAT